MIVAIQAKRRDRQSSFVQLVSYLSLRDEKKPADALKQDTLSSKKSRSKAALFNRLIDYVDRHSSPSSQQIIATLPDGSQRIKCDNVVCQTNAFSLETAAAEMNAVAANNRRCLDAVYHFILSWPEGEQPEEGHIFDSASYCLAQMGMADHQYVFALHRDTDNLHCHVAVNRIHPVSFRAANLYNDVKILHKACRTLELKYDWKPDKGCWLRDENNHIIRAQPEYKSAPRAATQLEYYEDKESFHSYVVRTCRADIKQILTGNMQAWEAVHAIFLRANVELKMKGAGLAIYNKNSPDKVPLKASRLHPLLTLAKLEPRIGPFETAPKIVEFKNENGDVTLTNYAVDSAYNPKLHLRDRDARMVRRLARAEAREDLKARYQTYKKEWKRPTVDTKNQFKTLAAEFRVRKAHVRVAMPDPLMRKLTYHILAFEREKAMAALRLQLKEERTVLKNSPENRRASYRMWVEHQALKSDKAAISQLRRWAYKVKRDDRTALLTDNVIQCAVADDIPPFRIEGFDTKINRDGAILYQKEGITQIVDRGEQIGVARPFDDRGVNMITALSLAEDKSGETLAFTGPPDYVNQACAAVPHFNAMGDKPLSLTELHQQQLAGYFPARKVKEEVEVAKPRPQPTWRPR
ncbi:TraI/MobA(P) family conjugative relaxase [Candidatus Fukatsuia symbiotica]|uniref:Molybdopterin-guanine dinucleotide biosynthesis protein MobA n=1 Tax=Candidatus Fukatsuia symbiotica TaxID=1878942 RepID=A0A2Y9CKK9_9GAMM|nr:TraI/MobA(P) family conjugative relaxase [Candidatus Fukatsuia symbiotica]AWK15699.1 molybdopterin-guanine dinucleotide biosynthesis protein MobA [Candidatus Fukatsuia symbiotica]MEA9446108.1 TraI/MobA(P) family conjugative relaxase [Candidatus Fukatsuia symbiotica]